MAEFLLDWARENLSPQISHFGMSYPFDNKESRHSFCAVIGGVWRAMRDSDENYVYSFALYSPPK